MKRLFLRRGGYSRLIVFFSGWGMDERPFAHLAGRGGLAHVFGQPSSPIGRKISQTPDADFLLCYDYTVPEDRHEFEEILAPYERVSLAAFSLGVWAAAESLDASGISFDDAVAINGTLRPVDAEYGIPPELFERTGEKWSEKTRARFYRRMCGDAKTLEYFLARGPARSIESQRAELLAVGRRISSGGVRTGPFRRAFIGSGDRVFPPEAQRRFWETQGVEIVESTAPHYPFADLDLPCGCTR